MLFSNNGNMDIAKKYNKEMSLTPLAGVAQRLECCPANQRATG